MGKRSGSTEYIAQKIKSPAVFSPVAVKNFLGGITAAGVFYIPSCFALGGF